MSKCDECKLKFDDYENMANDTENDFKKMSQLSNRCQEAIIDNEIYIVTNEELWETSGRSR